MKKIVVAGFLLSCLLVPYKSFATSIYEGIWMLTGIDRNIYCTINENNGTLVLVFLDQFNGSWQAAAGQLNGNKVRYSTLIGYLQFTEDITFTSNTTATLIQRSCYPIVFGWSCAAPNGTSYNMQKIW